MSTILVIEDENPVLEIINRILTIEGFDVITAENGTRGLELAHQHKIDLIISDVMMPDIEGFDVLSRIRTDVGEIKTVPFIFLTARSTREDQRRGMEIGADDYLIKPFTKNELVGAVKSQLAKSELLANHYGEKFSNLKEQIDYILHYDALTGLPNQQTLQEKFLDVVVNKVYHFSLIVPIFYVRLDRFKTISGGLGQKHSDQLIKQVSDRFKSCLDNQDVIARLSRDEFAIVILPVEHKQQVEQVAKILVREFNEPFLINDKEVFVTLSIGVALYPRDDSKIDKLLGYAKRVTERIEEDGGNGWDFFSEVLDIQNKAQLQLEADLRHAIERNQLEVVYQPQVDLETGTVISAEALLRWHHPHRGDVPPAKFIPIAEETGLIEPIGNWMLEQACLQLKQWHNQGWSQLKLSANLSARQFNQRDICSKLVDIFKQTAIKTNCIELEITEGTLVQHPAFAIRKLRQLSEMGIQVAIDDFGTGYSSLSYLQQFPFHILKIDRSFIHQIDRNDRNEAITKAIIELAHNLSLAVVAEGVETEQELKILKKFNCDVIQGYLFSPPLKARSFEHLLESNKTLARLAQLKL